MRKRIDRKKLILIFSIFFVSVISLSVVYAALSTTLRISGSSEVVSSSWKITIQESDGWFLDEAFKTVFNMDGNFVKLGYGNCIKKGTIVGTSINDYAVSVTVPGDAAAFYYDVINQGNIPAILTDINYSEFEVVSENNNANDVALVSEFVHPISGMFVNFELSPTLNIGDVLCPGDKRAIAVGVETNVDATAVPSSKVYINNINSEIIFTQGDLSLCS